jgi:hypothetical protein
MALKKTSKGGKRKKSSKKSSKNSKDRLWENEGGVAFKDENTNGGEVDEAGVPVKRKRRDTQDRDERIRRSKTKLEFKLHNSLIKQKWKNKVNLSDFLCDKDELESDHEIENTIEKQPKLPYRKSSLSIMDRLTSFVGQSISKTESFIDENQQKKPPLNNATATHIEQEPVNTNENENGVSVDHLEANYEEEIVSDREIDEDIENIEAEQTSDLETKGFIYLF